MDWIKKRYDQFALALVTVLLLAFAVMVLLKTGSFPEKFAEAAATVPPNNKIPPVALSEIERAKVALQDRDHIATELHRQIVVQAVASAEFDAALGRVALGPPAPGHRRAIRS